MELINWNIQWGRGADGKVDLQRTVDAMRQIADADVLCLQEVTRGFGELRGSPGVDQVAELSALLPAYQVLFAPGVDRRTDDGKPRQFGNVIATRLPIREIFTHALPWPADPGVASMPRVALEITVNVAERPVRIICTHLEYYSATQRVAQADALREWHEEACQHARHPGRGESAPGPFTPEPRPLSAILCGDFNSKPADPAYQHMLAPFPGGAVAWQDAWQRLHPGQPHAPTCGLYDREQWHEPPFACDFIFVTEDLAGNIATCEIEDTTQASDHQPLHLSLAP